MSVDQNKVEHFGLRKHFDGARRDLAAESLVGAEKKLLAGLPSRIERPRDLRAAKGTIGQQAAVLASERDALLDAVIDDQIADFGETINVRFTGAEIAALNRVVEKTKHAVAVV